MPLDPTSCLVCRRPGAYTLPEVQIDGPAWVCSAECEGKLRRGRLPDMDRPIILHYTLDEQHRPVPEPDVHKWARWFETAERHLALDEVGEFRVSTVFLGADHNHGGRPGVDPPILWETMIFGPDEHPLDQEQRRYTSREGALLGHASLLAEVYKVAGAGSPPNGEATREQEPTREPDQPPGDK